MSVFQRTIRSWVGLFGNRRADAPEEPELIEIGGIGTIRIATTALGALAIWILLVHDFPVVSVSSLTAAIAAGLSLVGAALAATTARYLAAIEPTQLPEAPGLCRGARLTAWMLLLTAISIGFVLTEQQATRILLYVVLAINVGVCYGLIAIKESPSDLGKTFPLDLGVLSIFGR